MKYNFSCYTLSLSHTHTHTHTHTHRHCERRSWSNTGPWNWHTTAHELSVDSGWMASTGSAAYPWLCKIWKFTSIRGNKSGERNKTWNITSLAILFLSLSHTHTLTHTHTHTLSLSLMFLFKHMRSPFPLPSTCFYFLFVYPPSAETLPRLRQSRSGEWVFVGLQRPCVCPWRDESCTRKVDWGKMKWNGMHREGGKERGALQESWCTRIGELKWEREKLWLYYLSLSWNSRHKRYLEW